MDGQLKYNSVDAPWRIPAADASAGRFTLALTAVSFQAVHNVSRGFIPLMILSTLLPVLPAHSLSPGRRSGRSGPTSSGRHCGARSIVSMSPKWTKKNLLAVGPRRRDLLHRGRLLERGIGVGLVPVVLGDAPFVSA